MRITAVILIWITLFGGLFLYMQLRGKNEKAVEYSKPPSRAIYELRIYSTTALEPNEYSLPKKIKDKGPSIRVLLNGEEIYVSNERILFKKPIVIKDVKGISVGMNELFIEAFPPIKSTNKQNALRLVLFKGGGKVFEKTYWYEGGQKIGSTVLFEIDK